MLSYFYPEFLSEYSDFARCTVRAVNTKKHNGALTKCIMNAGKFYPDNGAKVNAACAKMTD